MTLYEAGQRLDDPLYMGAMLVRDAQADLCIAGNLSSTANVLRAAIHVLGVAPGLRTVSSFFAMISPDGESVYAFADAAVLPDPTPEQLADIAVATAAQYERLTANEPRVAMLSFSSKGSAQHAKVDKVREATGLVQAQAPGLKVDGELQFDAAVDPEVAALKAPGSILEGHANVLVFPSLESANIAYKLLARLGKAKAIGPILLGVGAPVHVLQTGDDVNAIVQIASVAVMDAMGRGENGGKKAKKEKKEKKEKKDKK